MALTLYEELSALGPIAARRRIRALAKQLHPDHGGSGDAMVELLEARRRLEIRPVIRSGCSVKWRGKWWRVVSNSGKYCLIKYSHSRNLTVNHKDIEDVCERRSGWRVVCLRHSDWQRIKKELGL